MVFNTHYTNPNCVNKHKICQILYLTLISFKLCRINVSNFPSTFFLFVELVNKFAQNMNLPHIQYDKLR